MAEQANTGEPMVVAVLVWQSSKGKSAASASEEEAVINPRTKGEKTAGGGARKRTNRRRGMVTGGIRIELENRA